MIAKRRAELEQLAALDPDYELFGSEKHRYRLEPVLSEGELVAFEREHRLELPREYRAFLAELGNGGAGPDYGIKPLAAFRPSSFVRVTSVISGPDVRIEASTPERASLARAADPSRPFPLTGAWGPPPRREEDPWPEGLPEGANPYDGTVKLADIGCGYFFFLVINGPRSGEVWNDSTAADYPLAPVATSFFEWYDEWLDRSLRERALAVMQLSMKEDSDWVPRADLLCHLHRFERAPESPASRMALGYAHLYQRKFVEATACFEAAGTGDSCAHSDQVAVAMCLMARVQDQHERVLELVDAALEKPQFGVPARAELLTLRMVSHRELGRLHEALDAAEALVAFRPYESFVYFEKARLQVDLGDLSGAEQTLVRGELKVRGKRGPPMLAQWLTAFAEGLADPEASAYFVNLAASAPR